MLSHTHLNCRGQILDLTTANIMGILNVTPDSYYAEGRCLSPELACERALQMIEEGAAIIDIGGESTRPGAIPLDSDEELRRVIPVIEKIRSQTDHPLSIDTSSPIVMRKALDMGVNFINDVRSLMRPGAMELLASYSDVPVCLMHMQGEPDTMQQSPHYENVVLAVKDFLAQRMDACMAAGITQNRIVIDPGFGFGKTAQHNLHLLQALSELTVLDVPILVGLSRKAMIGKLLGLPVTERLPASLALAVMAVMHGAKLVRVHDVKPTIEAIAMVNAMQGAT